MKNSSFTTRRTFGKSAAATLLATLAGKSNAQDSTNKRLNVACIGVGGKGLSGMKATSNCANVIALCDVDRKNLTKAAADQPYAKQYEDYREMFDYLADSLDAVVISTPDHSHYPVAMAAIKRAKHVFIEKPLSNSMWETEQLLVAASLRGVKTQMGNQGRLVNSRQMVKTWVNSGLIGNIKELHVWTNRPIWPQGSEVSFAKAAPPPDLNWPLWLGSVPDQDYIEGIHPYKWRGFVDFGSGAMDMGQHLLDVPLHALDLGAPNTVIPDITDRAPRVYPKSSHLTYQFSNKGNFELHWYDGGKRPTLPNVIDDSKARGGYFMVGSEGYIYDFTDYGGSPTAVSLSGRTIREEKPEHTGRNTMVEDWVSSIMNESRLLSPWDEAGPLTEFCILGNLAAVTNRTLHWDAATRTTGVAEADQLLKRKYRPGWEISAADR